VAAHGDSYRTLVHGCLPPQKRADFTASLIQIKNDFSATKEQKDWAEDMLRLLRWMERDLNNQNPYHADDSLSYATLLWLPKLSKLLAHRAWIATVGKQPMYARIGPPLADVTNVLRVISHWDGTPYLIQRCVVCLFLLVILLLSWILFHWPSRYS
jgi:hypothetical protein